MLAISQIFASNLLANIWYDAGESLEYSVTIITITNQKGGCGKTVTASNLACGLARKGNKVLLMDLDPQAPLATGLGVEPPDDLLPIAEAIRKRRVGELVQPTPTANLFVAPGDVSLDHQALANEPLRDTVIQRALAPLKGKFDYILLDTPPHLDLVTLNAIMAADWLILPCDADKESLQSLKRTIAVAFTYIEHRPEIDPATFYKVLVTIFDDRDKTMNGWFSDELAKLSNPPFKTKIHRATAFKKARAYGLSIFDYTERYAGQAGGKRGVADFEQLTDEVIAYGSQR
jgi:chromosome partitioning protein